MNELLAAVGRIIGQLSLWIIVQPWETALRTRAGKRQRVLSAGFHWRIPILDHVVKQSSRARVSMVPTQTLTTRDGRTLAVGIGIGYRVTDIVALYGGFEHAEDTIVQVAADIIAGFVTDAREELLNPLDLSETVAAELGHFLAQHGLTEVTVRVTDFAFVRSYRLLQDKRWGYAKSLDTTGPQ